MAVKKLFPTKDTTLYTEYPNMNTGLDEIIEASTYVKNSKGQVSRYLIKFSDDEIKRTINNIGEEIPYKIYLRNFNAVITGLNLDSELEIFPISGSWEMGTGRFGDNPPTENGASWTWRDYASGSSKWEIPSDTTYVTGSNKAIGVGAGGVWYYRYPTGPQPIIPPLPMTQKFTYANDKDVNVEVTEIVENWNAENIANEGFIVKQRNKDEFVDNINNQKTFRFFSIDTNTIYPPQLEFRWEDFIFNTGSSTNKILPEGESFISLYNNVGVYYPQSTPRLRFAAMPKYPDRVFQTSSLYTTNYFLPPKASRYAIKDTETNEFVIDFDPQYTRISSDETSSYFDLDCSGLEPERYYTVLVEINKTDQTGNFQNSLIYDEDIMFKITKG